MPNPSIALCMIVKNVEKTITAALESVAPYVNEIIITDTGSDDRSKEVIWSVAPRATILNFTPQTHPEAFLLDVKESWPEDNIPGQFTGKHMLANFGAARQYGWSRSTTDFIMWIDADDVVENAHKIPFILNDMKEHQLDTALLNYDYALDEHGNVICKLSRERILRRSHGATWHQPIHEVIAPIGKGRFYTECNIKHLRHQYKLPSTIENRNLKVLCKWWQEHKNDKNPDPRMIFYLGMETRYVWPDRAIEHFEHYCKISGWDEERSIAHLLAGSNLEQRGMLQEAFSHFCQAALEAQWKPEPYFSAARVAYFKRDWAKCIEWSEKGFDIAKQENRRHTVLMYDPMDHLYRPHIFYSVALIETGRLQEALDSCNAGLKYNPNDPYLKGNKELIENHLNNKSKPMPSEQPLRIRQDLTLDALSQDIPLEVLVTFTIEMWKQNMEKGLYTRALQLLNAAPLDVTLHPHVRRAQDLTIKSLEKVPDISPKNPVEIEKNTPAIQSRPKPEGSLSIIIWTGPGWEKWSPKTLAHKALGGSETAAISMARELARRGHIVRVVSQCEDDEGYYGDGVQYIHYEKVARNPKNYNCDILVVSRQPAVFDLGIPHKASFVWVHDIHLGEPHGRLGELLLKADKFFCLSEWHKGFFLKIYPFLHQDDVIVTKNGIDLNLFEEEPQKIGNRLIYSSSPDRGLERLIEIFPQIKAQVPDAELDVYYGFHNWRSMAQAANNQAELERIKKFEELLEKSRSIGINYHGGVSKPELAKAFLHSKVWAYPTWFTETYCITALEAQAAGCVPVTSALAALPETISHGFIIQKFASNTQEYADIFVKRVVKLLTNEEERSKYAQGGREYAFAYHGWDHVAKSWEDHFKRILEIKAKNPLTLPRFGD